MTEQRGVIPKDRVARRHGWASPALRQISQPMATNRPPGREARPPDGRALGVVDLFSNDANRWTAVQ